MCCLRVPNPQKIPQTTSAKDTIGIFVPNVEECMYLGGLFGRSSANPPIHPFTLQRPHSGPAK